MSAPRAGKPTAVDVERAAQVADSLRLELAGAERLRQKDNTYLVGELQQLRKAIESGQRWWEPYCKPGASDAEKIAGLTDACAYWHAVAERET